MVRPLFYCNNAVTRKKKHQKISFASLVIASSLLVGCASSADKVKAAEEKEEKSKQELKEEKQDYNKELEEYKKISKEKIAANEKKIADIVKREKNLKGKK